jgi:hypothetical protein
MCHFNYERARFVQVPPNRPKVLDEGVQSVNMRDRIEHQDCKVESLRKGERPHVCEVRRQSHVCRFSSFRSKVEHDLFRIEHMRFNSSFCEFKSMIRRTGSQFQYASQSI